VYTTGYTLFDFMTFMLLPQFIDKMFENFYMSQIFNCLSSEPLINFSFVLDQLTEFTLSPCPGKE